MEFGFKNYFRDIYELTASISVEDLISAAALIRKCNKDDGQVLIFGNGGSAAMASHVCVDLVKAAGIRASNFNEADLLTCFSNDYGYDQWVKKCIEFYARPFDVIIFISSSGQSENMLNGVRYANEMGLKSISLSGFSPDNPLRGLAQINIYAASSNYNYVEMTHHIWLLSLVDFLAEGSE